MERKALSSIELKTYTDILDENLVGRYISSPVMYAKDTFIFHVSGRGKSNLLICLDGEFPRIYLSDSQFEGSSFDDKFLMVLKKEVSNAYITNISQISEDRILNVSFTSLNSVFKEERKKLIIELIPHHPNFIIVNEKNIVISAYRTSTIDSKHPILKGMLYLPLENKFHQQNPVQFDLNEFEETCLTEETNIYKKRKNEKFGYAITRFKNRKKLLERKIKYLNNDIEEGKKHLDDSLKGDAIYICYSSLNNRQGFFEYEGLKIDLDPSRSLSQNAERYYKRSKKAKETISNAEKFLLQTQKELENVNDVLSQIDVANENSLETYANLFKIPLAKSKKADESLSCGLSSDSIPYFVTYNGTKILFGKSAKQNTFLTFMYDTSKEHLWFHIQGRSGSHVIIKKDNPTNEEIRVACEICLINSNQEDGDIIYAKRKYVKKGHVLGEAILKEFKTIHLKNVTTETKELLKNAERIKLR